MVVHSSSNTPASASGNTSSSVSRSSSGAADAVPIKCLGLTKVFKDFWLRNRVTAVNNIDLEVHRGEVFGLLGPNGSGKSTTIKMILGLLNPTEGKIAVLGRAPSDVAIKKNIGYLPEESYLYRFLTPGETLDYYGKLFGQDRVQRKKRIETLLEMVGLTHAARRPVGEFSKGMQRKVGLAQALINDPDLLILDEPTSGMDPIATAEVKQVILELKRRGKTVLLCSHLLGDVQDVCDRVVVMYGGKIREEGPLDDLLKVQDKTIIETDHLQDELVTKLERLLEQHGHAILKSSHPRKDLDQLFMEIVEKARTEGARTAGATQGGRIAEFLSDGQSPVANPADNTEQLLSALSEPVSSTPPEVEVASEGTSGTPGDSEDPLASQAASSDGAAVSAPTPAADNGLLEQLLEDTKQIPAATPSEGGQDQDQPDPSASAQKIQDQAAQDQIKQNADQSVLDALLGSDDNDKKN